MHGDRSQPARFLPVTAEDLARLNELANLPGIVEHFESIPPVPMASTQAFWGHVQQGLVSLWTVRTGDRVVGGAGFYVQAPGTRLSHAATFFLYLDPAVWGRGIGTATLRFIEAEVRARGFRRLDCMVAATNPGAIRLYRKEGFEVEGTRREAFCLDGRYEDLVMMGKVIAGPNAAPGAGGAGRTPDPQA